MQQQQQSPDLNSNNFTSTIINQEQTQSQLQQQSEFDQEREEFIKHEYYKSNPLRNYAPTRGQTILPPPSISSIHKKKQLPNIFKELREVQNIEQASETLDSDREDYKYKLKTMLKVNLNYSNDDLNRPQINSRENSKRIYTDICRKNLTQPIDVANVQSTLKISTFQSVNYSTNKLSSNMLQQTSAAAAAAAAAAATTTANAGVSQTYLPIPKPKSAKTKPLIFVKQARINSLEEIVDEIKSKTKYKMSSKPVYDNYDNQNIKYTYREQQFFEASQPNLNDSFNHNQYDIDEIDLVPHHQTQITLYDNAAAQGKQTNEQTNHHHHHHTDTNQLLRNSTNELEQNEFINSSDNNVNFKKRHNTANELYDHKHNEPQIRYEDDINEVPIKEKNHQHLHHKHNNNNNNATQNNETIMNAHAKHYLRVQQARDKILNSQTPEKANLNKLTIIQPFEDTKILINLNKVPSRVLNSLFNDKQRNNGPSYYIPPVKAFGFFTSKPTSDSGNTSNTPPNVIPGTVKPLTRLTHSTNMSKHSSLKLSSEERKETISKQQRQTDSQTSLVTPRFSNKEFNISKFNKPQQDSDFIHT